MLKCCLPQPASQLCLTLCAKVIHNFAQAAGLYLRAWLLEELHQSCDLLYFFTFTEYWEIWEIHLGKYTFLLSCWVLDEQKKKKLL